jgi:short subunit dehydrogenase-like uncharacterized protein
VDVSLAITNESKLGGMADAVSGGTYTSGIDMIRRGGTGEVGRNPYVLDPPGSSASGRYSWLPRRHAGSGPWLAPVFPSPVLNPPVVHRGAALLRAMGDTTFAPTFRYREGVATGAMAPKPLRPLAPALAAAMAGTQVSFAAVGRTPAFLRRRLADGLERIGPKAGEGPRPESLDAWHYRLDARATDDRGTIADASVEADGHPGYKSTATLVAEAAIVLALGEGRDGVTGYLTPSTALGLASLPRFARAGARFTVG